MKRFLLVITSLMAMVTFAFGGASYAFADENSALIEEFTTCCETVETNINSTGITSETLIEVITASGRAVEIAEYMELNVDPEFKIKNRNAFETVFTAYKNANLKTISLSYDEALYTPTNNGIILIHQKEGEAISAIRSATSKVEIDTACTAFLDFIATTELSKYSVSVATSSETEIVATVTSERAIFSEEDYLTAVKFNNSVIEKNTQNSLSKSSNLTVIDGGVASYFSLRWVSGGVIQEDTQVPVTVSVNLSSLGLTVQDGTSVQIARYVKNGEVSFLEASVSEGNLVFSLTAFGGDIDSEYDLDFAVILSGYAGEEGSVVGDFLKDNWLILVIVICLIAIVSTVGAIAVRIRNKKLKKEFKRFKKERKKNKKNKNRRRER